MFLRDFFAHVQLSLIYVYIGFKITDIYIETMLSAGTKVNIG